LFEERSHGVASSERGPLTAGQAMKDDFKVYGEKIIDSLYNASVYSIIAYSGLLFLLAIVAMAVFLNLVDVPEFHPK
jgi:hypothetical protein